MKYCVISLGVMLSVTALAQAPLQISGIYPHLASFNNNGECGQGGVVEWAGKIWVITYPPHFRTGSDDKLYEIDPKTMKMVIRPESVGGTHANRLIHRESNQLIIGSYFIDDKGNVRSVDVKKMPGRYTASARHLTDPANKVYFFDMEGPVWEVDVKTLEPKRLFLKPVPGWHGKGAYTGQGVFVVANNGESMGGGLPKEPFEAPTDTWSKGPEEAGVLAEWNGKGAEGWKVINRRQHVEVSGPGGLMGNAKDSDPIWSTGWDKRSVMLHVRDAETETWSLYRLPRASHTYDPKHGYYTEWPRIREIVPATAGAPAKLMMTMHGAMFDFPIGFRKGQTAGIRQINSYVRYVPDFSPLSDGRIVLASDDTSIMQNPMAGISQSNLWFGKFQDLAGFGPAAGWGGVWMSDKVTANIPSDPYLFAGYQQRGLHLACKEAADFRIEIDEKGDGQWKTLQTHSLGEDGYLFISFPPQTPGEWIRITANRDCTAAAFFHYLTPSKYPGNKPDGMFASLAAASDKRPVTAGLIRPGKEGQLQFLTQAGQYYEVDEKMNFVTVSDPGRVTEMQKFLEIKPIAQMDDASPYIATKSVRLRFPRNGNVDSATHRHVRELESERNMANLYGTFFEVPRGGDQWKNMKPIASHAFNISDFCTWRGLLVLAGTTDSAADGHYFKSGAGHGLWFGAIDDLWRLGKPVGVGGPWKNSAVKADDSSDPYLMCNYDRKKVELSASDAVTITIEVDPANNGSWKAYKSIPLQANTPATHVFPDGFGAYWVRVKSSEATTATATFTYE